MIVFSSELPELISLCDRVLVMHAGGLAGEVVGDDITEVNIMRYAAAKSVGSGEWKPSC